MYSILSTVAVVSSLGILTLVSAQNNTTLVGDLFYFEPGLGACGFTNTSAQYVASVPQDVFFSFPGATSNPNDNPICTHNITLSSNGTNVSAQVVDYCPTCDGARVGLSDSAFENFAPLSQGIVPNVSWVID